MNIYIYERSARESSSAVANSMSAACFRPSHADPSIRAHAAVAAQVASDRPDLTFQVDERSSMKIRSAAAEFPRLRGRTSDPPTASAIM